MDEAIPSPEAATKLHESRIGTLYPLLGMSRRDEATARTGWWRCNLWRLLHIVRTLFALIEQQDLVIFKPYVISEYLPFNFQISGIENLE